MSKEITMFSYTFWKSQKPEEKYWCLNILVFSPNKVKKKLHFMNKWTHAFFLPLTGNLQTQNCGISKVGSIWAVFKNNQMTTSLQTGCYTNTEFGRVLMPTVGLDKQQHSLYKCEKSHNLPIYFKCYSSGSQPFWLKDHTLSTTIIKGLITSLFVHDLTG